MAFTHVPAAAKNSERVMKKIMAVLYGEADTHEADQPVGAATRNRARRRVWVSTGAPSSGTVTGIALGDMCLDVTNDKVYIRTAVAAASGSFELLVA